MAVNTIQISSKKLKDVNWIYAGFDKIRILFTNFGKTLPPSKIS